MNARYANQIDNLFLSTWTLITPASEAGTDQSTDPGCRRENVDDGDEGYGDVSASMSGGRQAAERACGQDDGSVPTGAVRREQGGAYCDVQKYVEAGAPSRKPQALLVSPGGSSGQF